MSGPPASPSLGLLGSSWVSLGLLCPLLAILAFKAHVRDRTSAELTNFQTSLSFFPLTFRSPTWGILILQWAKSQLKFPY